MGDRIPLGKAAVRSGTSIMIKPKTPEERITALESQIRTIQNRLPSKPKETDREEGVLNVIDGEDLNRDGIPVDINFIGLSNNIPYVLTVKEDGYYVGSNCYQSLSSAAEAVSGCRRSGWTFWKLLDGRTAKEVFKRR
jgi:hypothetical protein